MKKAFIITLFTLLIILSGCANDLKSSEMASNFSEEMTVEEGYQFVINYSKENDIPLEIDFESFCFEYERSNKTVTDFVDYFCKYIDELNKLRNADNDIATNTPLENDKKEIQLDYDLTILSEYERLSNAICEKEQVVPVSLDAFFYRCYGLDAKEVQTICDEMIQKYTS